MVPSLHESLKYAARLLPVVCLVGFAPCHADDVSEQGYLQDMPIVLSASRLRQPISETPNAVTVIDRAMIEASGFRNIVDLFKLVPGMYVDYFNGHMPIVSYRGTTDEYTRRMQVLVDGRSVYLPPYGVVDWEDLPLHMNDIERIEIVRGPAATSYGSNSILGVINIITREAFALNGASISATRGNAGNAGISDAVAHLGRSWEQLDYRLTFGMRSDNGFDFPVNSPSWFDGYNDSSATHFASLRSNYRLSEADSLDLQLGFSNGDRKLGDPRSRLSQPRNIESNSGYQQLTWLHTLNQHDDIKLNYYHISRHSMSGNFSGADRPGFWITDNYKVHRHELEMQHTLRTNSNNRLVWGMATRYDSVDAPSTFSAPQSLHQHRLFAHDEWRISPSLLLNAGAMLEDDGMDHKRISPRVALNYHATPKHTFRTSVSVAYRNPALAEERSDRQFWLGGPWREWLSSGGLRPERTLSREIGYLGKFDNGLSIDVRAYNDQVSDIIWIDNNLAPGSIWLTFGLPAAVDFRNMFAAQYTGLEGSAKYSWGERNSLTLSFAHQNVSCEGTGSPYLASSPAVPPALAPFVRDFVLSRYAVQVQDYTKTVPLNSGSLLYAGQMGGGISFSAGYYQQGNVTVLSATTPQPLTRRVDMRIAKQFKPTGRVGGGEISLVVQNVFQNDNVGYSGYLFDRRAFVTATLNF